MTHRNGGRHCTPFTVSIDAAEGVSSGISAADRARTVEAAVARAAKPGDLVQPGHIFPLQAQDGGVLKRAGHTEAGCDLAGLAGLEPASVICEILKDDGTMARLPDLIPFAHEHGLKIGAIADLIHYRSQTESLVERAADRLIQTVYGAFRLVAYRDKCAKQTHLALVKGEIVADRETLVRVHEPLSVMDFLDVTGGGHSWPILGAMERIAESQCGVIVLLHRPETADALLQRINPPPVASHKYDLRDYGIGAQILRDLGVGKMKLLASPRKMPAMDGFGLEVTGYSENA
jgi:3,4-dihydroxy 2-butanone 4-phosphate synthase/GTP cyclohydrolase II